MDIKINKWHLSEPELQSLSVFVDMKAEEWPLGTKSTVVQM